MVARQGSKGPESSKEAVSEKLIPAPVGLKDEFGKQGWKTF